MTGLLRKLLDRLDRTEIKVSPDGGIEKHDVVVGVVEDDGLRCLWNLFYEVARELNAAKRKLTALCLLEADQEENSPRHKELHELICQLELLFDAVKVIFWASLREEFRQLQDKDSVGIREGWQVVYIDEEKKVQGHLSAVRGLITLANLLGSATDAES